MHCKFHFFFLRNISIHALHAECDQRVKKAGALAVISIHALHAECDYEAQIEQLLEEMISIHALHAECDPGKGRQHRVHAA